MQQTRLSRFAELAVYPVLMAPMLLGIRDAETPLGRALTLGVALAAAFLSMLLESWLHRFLPYGGTRSATAHIQHEGSRRSWVETSVWLSVAVVAFIAFVCTGRETYVLIKTIV